MHKAHKSGPLHVYSVSQAYLVYESPLTKSFVIVTAEDLNGCTRGFKALHTFKRKSDEEQENWMLLPSGVFDDSDAD